MSLVKKPTKANISRLETLPGETRNQIFELCIRHSRRHQKKAAGLSPFTVSVFPRWSGPGVMRTSGIGPLPLLFVSKGIFRDLSSLIYSEVDCVSIGGYPVQSPDEDPSIRWSVVYPLLSKQPSLRKFTRSVKIRMPMLREDLKRGLWISLSLEAPKRQAATCNPWAVVPGLTNFLRSFEQLEAVEIVVTVEPKEAPDFEGLLPLYDLHVKQVAVEFASFIAPGISILPVSLWKLAWEQCLQRSGRS